MEVKTVKTRKVWSGVKIRQKVPQLGTKFSKVPKPRNTFVTAFCQDVIAPV